MDAVTEWAVKLVAKPAGVTSRRSRCYKEVAVVKLTTEEVGLTLAEGKDLVGGFGAVGYSKLRRQKTPYPPV
jgi:PP-loop superfamily ATP-utilizing enzyme